MIQTPLHVAAGYNNIGIVKFLLNWSGPEKVELEAKNMVIRSRRPLQSIIFFCRLLPFLLVFLPKRSIWCL